jgi:hypothetical protein
LKVTRCNGLWRDAATGVKECAWKALRDPALHWVRRSFWTRACGPPARRADLRGATTLARGLRLRRLLPLHGLRSSASVQPILGGWLRRLDRGQANKPAVISDGELTSLGESVNYDDRPGAHQAVETRVAQGKGPVGMADFEQAFSSSREATVCRSDGSALCSLRPVASGRNFNRLLESSFHVDQHARTATTWYA